jgi:CRP-like cAMP-binding protein
MQTLLKKIADTVSAFRGLKVEELAEIFQFAEKQIFQPGDPIVVEGKVGSFMYILIDGEAIVSKRTGPGASAELRRLGPGDCFGEMSIVDNEPRSASVTAATIAILLRLNAQALQIRPEIGVRVFRNIARGAIEKLRALEAQMKGQLGAATPLSAPTESEQ